MVGQLRERLDSGKFPACITLAQSAGPTGTGDAKRSAGRQFVFGTAVEESNEWREPVGLGEVRLGRRVFVRLQV